MGLNWGRFRTLWGVVLALYLMQALLQDELGSESR